MERESRVVMLAAAAVFLLLPIANLGAQEGAAGDAPKTTEQVYKNIKVLKGVPADQLLPAMQFISASLGEGCDFCHVQGHFEQDDKKPKETARQMMTMMFAINKENFNGTRKVSCYSCHHGSAKPLVTPVVEEQAAAKPMLAPPAEEQVDLSKLPAPADLIEKYVQAAGGASAIDGVSTRVEHGTVTGFGGRKFPIDIFDKAPNKSAAITHYPNGESRAVCDGNQGWLAFPGRPAREMEGADLEGAKIDSDLHLATDLKHMFKELKSAAPEKIEDRDTYHVLGMNPGQPPVEFYFDQQSGLLVRQVRYAQSPVGLYPTQVDYADYRDQDGVKIPFRVVTSHPGNSFTLQLEQIQQNVPLEEANFAKPAPPAAAGKK